jgi:hypothetical protein
MKNLKVSFAWWKRYKGSMINARKIQDSRITFFRISYNQSLHPSKYNISWKLSFHPYFWYFRKQWQHDLEFRLTIFGLNIHYQLDHSNYQNYLNSIREN